MVHHSPGAHSLPGAERCRSTLRHKQRTIGSTPCASAGTGSARPTSPRAVTPNGASAALSSSRLARRRLSLLRRVAAMLCCGRSSRTTSRPRTSGTAHASWQSAGQQCSRSRAPAATRT
eukprot:scaffold102096_cov74-Phaeocystis_antarctica.AAC.1